MGIGNLGPLKVHIEERYDKHSIDVWVMEPGYNGEIFYNINNEMRWIEETVVPKGQVPSATLKPFMSIPVTFGRQLFKAFADYNNKIGIKTKDENLIEGKLAATEKHLEDMRMITAHLLKMPVLKESK